MKKARNVSVLMVGLMAMLPALANGQDLGPQPPLGTAAPAYMQSAGTPAAPQAYTQEQIDQLLAPIALYPDQLVSQILMASTYPLEVVEAERWREQPQNAQLQGAGLEQALEQQPWDPSVKSLVPFPQVLEMMNKNLQWTEQLGDAFLASQPAVMGEVQNLRQKAQAAGNLQSTPQQTVADQQGDIVIQPANPQVVYVPYYNPTVVYGPWPWVAYPPYYFPPPPGYVYYNVGLFGFGIGLAVADWYWGWGRWDWHRHEMFVDDHRFEWLNRGEPPHFHGDVWAHDPDHRHGVPYRSAAVRQRFGGEAMQARENYRGYFNAQNRGAANIRANADIRASEAHGPHSAFERPAENRAAPETRSNMPMQHMTETHAATPESHAYTAQRSIEHQAQRPEVQRPTATRAAPMFESFSRGAEVHQQSVRGAESRASMANFHAPAPQAPHMPSTPHGGYSGGAPHGGYSGGHGGDNGHDAHH